MNTQCAEQGSTAVHIADGTRAALQRIVRRSLSATAHRSTVESYIHTLISRTPPASMRGANVVDHLWARIQAGRVRPQQ